MAKVLLPLNNTPWGVIKNPIAQDKYENILSFESDELKTQFIGEHLFNNRDFDYKAAIEETKHITSFTRITDVMAFVKLDLDDLQETIQGVELKYTLDDLLNIDFMIVKEDDKILFYTINEAVRTKNQNSVTVEFSLELDIMFNYYDDLDIQGEVIWNRGHTQRISENFFLTENNWFREDALAGFIPSYVDERHDLVSTEVGGEEMSKMTWCVIAVTLKEGEQGVIMESKKDNSNGKWYHSYAPFKLFIFPVNMGDSQQYTAQYFVVDKNGKRINWGGGTYNKFRDDSNIISVKYFQGYPLEKGYFTKVETDSLGDVNFHVNAYFGDYDWGWDYTTQYKHTSFYGNGNCIELKQYRDKFHFRDLKDIYAPSPYSVTIEDEREMHNEVKLHMSQFKEYSMEGKNMLNPYIIKQEFIKESHNVSTLQPIKIGYKWMYQPTTLANLYYTKENILDNMEEQKLGLVTGGSLDLPWNKTAYNEYAAKNKQGESMGWANAAVKTGAGAATGAIAGSIVPGLGTAVGAVVGTAVGAVSGAMSLASNGVMLNDLHETPNQAYITDNNYAADQMTVFNPVVKVRTLPYEMMNKAYDYLYKYGYVLGLIGKFEDFNNTRYYFNRIQITEIYSNIQNRLSANIKQIINDVIANGTTVWHVRDLDTFKGINNYYYENLELNIHEAQQLEKKKTKEA